MSNDTLKAIEDKMHKASDGLAKDLATIRTGRATPNILDNVKVDYAGVSTQLNHMAGISVPDARLLVIQPWDRNSIRDIEKAILSSDLGLNPTSDGKVIRITIPPLSEERRQELIKVVHKRVEERKVTIRNLRRDALNELKELEKNKEISQDENKRAQDQLQQLTDGFIAVVEKTGQDKEEELKQV
ncbi:MAG: ribosome recycling factor [Dehalococcoidales bacterium]|nr:MAG: ribosome recycling factor [Dehalococcoidales bacterium]